MEDILKTVGEKLAIETTSYGALQYLQSFVARKKKSIGLDMTSQVIFHGASLLIARGDAADAGHALVWFIESADLFHLEGQNEKGQKNEYCDIQRLLHLLGKFTSAQSCGCVSVLYDPLHVVVLKSRLTMGKSADSAVSRRMHTFDEMCANIFEESEQWRNAYRVCSRLNLIPRAAGILNKWSSMPGCYNNEKPLFFARAIYTLLVEKKVPQAVQMVAASKALINHLDNVSCDPVRPGGNESGYLACWHLSIILTELAELPPAPRVDKVRLFAVLSTLYIGILERSDYKLIELHDKVGKEYFAPPSSKAEANPLNMIQALFGGGGNKGSNNNNKKVKDAPGTLGGMNVSDMMAMLDKMQRR